MININLKRDRRTEIYVVSNEHMLRRIFGRIAYIAYRYVHVGDLCFVKNLFNVI